LSVKQIARWIGVFVSFASVLFAIGTYFGVWNEWRGDNLLVEVATRFDSSYSEDAGRPVRPGDEAWPVVMRVIRKYSHAQLLAGREPRVFARFVAVASAQNEAAHGEWTAPTTPVALLYKEWPGHGFVPPEDVVFVGTIGDLHTWIQRDEGDFDFLMRTILFGVVSACVGVFLALPDKKTGSDTGFLAAGPATTIQPAANVEADPVDGKDEPTSAPRSLDDRGVTRG
jgi:hypothetical protein